LNTPKKDGTVDPKAAGPRAGTAMPNMDVSDQDARGITAYLYSHD